MYIQFQSDKEVDSNFTSTVANIIDINALKQFFFDSLLYGHDFFVNSDNEQIKLIVNSATRIKESKSGSYIEFTATATYNNRNLKDIEVKGVLSFNVE